MSLRIMFAPFCNRCAILFPMLYRMADRRQREDSASSSLEELVNSIISHPSFKESLDAAFTRQGTESPTANNTPGTRTTTGSIIATSSDSDEIKSI